MNPTYLRRLAGPVAILICALAATPEIQAAPISIATVLVSDPGNVGVQAELSSSGDQTFYGAVAYDFNIGKSDVTNAQYAGFLNAVDPTHANTLGLYSSAMATGSQGGISWNGSAYVVNTGYANKPVVDVSWYSAARFTNWLTNGQGSGGTETGVYTFTGLTSIMPLPADHSALSGAKWFLPTENEWFKAAYYKGGSTHAGYWMYPFQSNTPPTSQPPPGGSDSANFFDNTGPGYALTGSFSFDHTFTYLTDVGAYTSASSYYGAFDMGGEVRQWNETDIFGDGRFRGQRGGSWNDAVFTESAADRTYDTPTDINDDGAVDGFRVASVANLPEPGSLTMLLLGAVGLLAWRLR